MHPNQEKIDSPPVSPMLIRSTDAFYRELPELLKKHYGKWVAYHGDQCVGVGRTKTELYFKCVRAGIPEDEFEIRFVDSMALHDHDEINIPDV